MKIFRQFLWSLVFLSFMVGCKGVVNVVTTPTTMTDSAVGDDIPSSPSGNEAVVTPSKTIIPQAGDKSTNQEFPLTQKYVSELAVSPSFAADGVVFATIWNGGLVRSTDKGVSWQKIEGAYEICNRPTAVALSPDFGNDGVVTFGGSTWTGPDTHGARLNISLDGGNSWKEQIEVGGEYFPAIAFSPSFVEDRTYFVAQWGAALEKIVVDDSSWTLDWDSVTALDSTQLSCGTFFVHDVAVSPNYSKDQTLYLANSAQGLCKSVDGGESWIKPVEELNVVAVALSPAYRDDSTVIAGTTEKGLQISHDGGLSWSTPGEIPTNHWTDIVFSPNFAKDETVFASSTWGVFKSIDSGISWSAVNNGLADLYVEALAISPDYKNDSTVFAGTHIGIFKSIDGGTSWKFVSNDIDMGKVTDITTNLRPGYTNPSIALDSSGDAHIAGGGEDLFYQNNIGGVFNDPSRISVPDTEGHRTIEVSISVDSNDIVHITYRTATPGTPVENASLDQINYPIYYITNKNNEFSAPELVIPSSWIDGLTPDYRVSNPHIATDSVGNAHIAFETLDGFDGKNHIYYTNNSRGNFTEPVPVFPADVSAALDGLSVDSTGQVHVVAGKYYVIGVDNVFGTPLEVTEADMYNSELVVDTDGNAHIVYQAALGKSALFYTNNAEGDFQEPTQISSSGYNPTIALDEFGYVHIVSLRQVLISNEVQYWTNTMNGFNETLITDIGFGAAVVGQRWMAVHDGKVQIVFNNGRIGGGSFVGIFPDSSSAIRSTGAYIVGGSGPKVYYGVASIDSIFSVEPK